MTQIWVKANQDATVKQQYPDNNYGTVNPVEIGKKGSFIHRDFIQFPIPINLGTITSVKLYIYIPYKYWSSPTGIPAFIQAHLSASTFDQNLITWNNQPSASLLMGSSPWASISAPGWHSFDITSNFPGWNQDVPIRLKLHDEAAYTGWWLSISSTEAPIGFHAKLLIDYLDVAPSPSVVTLAPQSGDKEKNTVNWTQMPETDFDKYEIYRRKPGDAWALVKTETTQTTVTWDDPDVLVDGSSYEYYIKTYDLGGQTADSNIATMTKPKVDAFTVSDQSPLVGQTVQGNITPGTFNTALYYFDWDDGTPGWIASAIGEHTYSSVATYNVKARIENTGGWWSSLFAGPVITVVTQAPVAKIHVDPIVVDINEIVVLNASESYDIDITGSITLFEFDPGTGSFSINNGINPKTTVSFANYGTYIARVKVTDDSANTDIAQATVLVKAPVITQLFLYFTPQTGERLKNIVYDEDTKTFREGMESIRTSSSAINMPIGAKCQGDLGERDINVLKDIRDSVPKSRQVSIDIDGKIYTGEMFNIKIEKPLSSVPKTWVWTAQLRIEKEPEGARYS